MKSELLYVELKSGYEDNGPAWIGNAFFSKSGRSVYFNGMVLKKGKGNSGNFFDAETGEEYWISGIKKKGTNRHSAGSGVIEIDKDAVSKYLELRGLSELKKSKYRIVSLNNIPAKKKSNARENEKMDT